MRKSSLSYQNLKVHHRAQNSLPPIPILGKVNPIHTLQSISLQFILIPSSHLHLGLPSGIFPLGFHTKTLYTSLSSPMHTTCLVHFIHLDVICLMISGNQYKLWSSPSCKFFHSHVTPSCLGPNRLLITLFSLKHPRSMLFPSYESPSFTPIQNNWRNYGFALTRLQKEKSVVWNYQNYTL
jgi:hypothetical protein